MKKYSTLPLLYFFCTLNFETKTSRSELLTIPDDFVITDEKKVQHILSRLTELVNVLTSFHYDNLYYYTYISRFFF